jgi:hypothetical protein
VYGAYTALVCGRDDGVVQEIAMARVVEGSTIEADMYGIADSRMWGGEGGGGGLEDHRTSIVTFI